MASQGFSPMGFGALQSSMRARGAALEQKGVAIRDLGSAIGDTIRERRERKALEQKQASALARKEQMSLAAADTVASGNPDDVAQFMVAYPEAAEGLSKAWKFKSDESKSQNAAAIVKSLAALDVGDTDTAMRGLQGHAEYLKQTGADPRDTLGTMAMLADPATQIEAKKNLEMQLGALMAGEGDIKGYLAMRKQQQKKQPLQQGTGDMTGYSFDPNTGEFSVAPEVTQYLQAKAQKDVANKREKDRYVDAKVRQGINKDVTALLKDPVATYRAAQSLKGLRSRGTPAAQLAAVFSFMKALDPTSVVRETEQGMVYAAEGAAAQLAGMLTSLLGEGKLTDEGFDDLVATSEGLAASALNSARTEMDSYLDTYGGTLPIKYAESLKKRIPVMKERKQHTTKTGITFTVE